MKLLITGGYGFIGSNFIRFILRRHPDWQIVNIDALTYAGNLTNLADISDNPNYRFIHGRIEVPGTALEAMAGCDAVINFAAETHVDRSIVAPAPFVRTNVFGTQVLLDAAQRLKINRFIHISTDEVYGTLGMTGLFSEDMPLAPRSPYAASKAAADLLALAAFHTHQLPVSIVRPSNNYGPFQFPEKLIPLAITNLIENKKIPVYGRGENIRDWIYVDDTAQAIETVLLKGKPGEIYNAGGNNQRRNLEVVKRIVALLGKKEDSIEFVPDRPGHDFRYALNNKKIEQLGW
ncbi:MAG: dTDP-glucose 4,6-dehydratase, partial [bacterium]